MDTNVEFCVTHWKSRLIQLLRRDTRGCPTFPFVSGQALRWSSDVVIDSPLALENGVRLLEQVSSPLVVFSTCDFAAAACATLRSRGDRVVLVVHDGDVVPTDLIEDSADSFRRVFCVNWLGSHPNVQPIPIGLENAAIGRNGRARYFSDCLPSNRLAQISRPRPISVLSAFRDQTNRAERQGLSERFDGIADALCAGKEGFTPSHYRKLLRQSRFVVSPPGNGPDCHRTWEAIYAGAVPIVLKRAWPFPKGTYPALVVDNWDEALALNLDQDLYSVWASLDARSSYLPEVLRGIWDALGHNESMGEPPR